MSPEFVEKWEKLLADVDKKKIPVEFVRKIILRLRGKKQHTINIEKFIKQGLDPEDIEVAITSKLEEIEEDVVSMEFILNVQTIADAVQPETDKLLKKL